MADIIDDTETISINVTYPEGIADLHDVVYPATVIAGEEFNITYQVTNNGSWSDTLWGVLLDNNGDPVAGTYWSEIIDAGATVYKTITMTLSEPFNGELQAGHVE